MKHEVTKQRCMEVSLLMAVMSGAENMPDECGKTIRKGAELLRKIAWLCNGLSAETEEPLSDRTRQLKHKFSEHSCLEVSQRIISMADDIPEGYSGTIMEEAEMLRNMAEYCADLCHEYDTETT